MWPGTVMPLVVVFISAEKAQGNLFGVKVLAQTQEATAATKTITILFILIEINQSIQKTKILNLEKIEK